MYHTFYHNIRQLCNPSPRRRLRRLSHTWCCAMRNTAFPPCTIDSYVKHTFIPFGIFAYSIRSQCTHSFSGVSLVCVWSAFHSCFLCDCACCRESVCIGRRCVGISSGITYKFKKTFTTNIYILGRLRVDQINTRLGVIYALCVSLSLL